jgi:ATP-dependent RNA helicase DeaD
LLIFIIKKIKVFNIMKKFSDLKLSENLKKVLSSMGYTTMTEVQEQTIPLIMEGKDVLTSSQTGTGKTGAFLIPIIAMIENDKNKHALIVTPTRELAKQIYDVINQMLYGNKRDAVALLIGGESISRQFRQLKQKPKIVIGTPGRINDHLIRKTLNLNQTDFLVLDETDRMLDMGFGVQIDEILKFMPEKKQTTLFSATLPKAIIKLSAKYLKDPARITIGIQNSIKDKITQNIIETETKFETLIEELNKTTGLVLIFIRTQRTADKLKTRLKDKLYKVDVLHGGMKQNKRARAMEKFRDGKCRILVVTDLASRGLDVPDIGHVFNYDLPDCPEDYIHRIGRTARAEKSGIAISLISKSDKSKWNSVQKFLNAKEDKITPNQRNSRTGKNFGKSRNQGDRSRNRIRGDERRGNRKFGEEKRSENRKFDGERKNYENRKPFGNKRFGEERQFYRDRKPEGNRFDNKINNEKQDRNSEYGYKKNKERRFGRNRSFGEKRFSDGKFDGERTNYGNKKFFRDRKFSRNENFDGERKSFRDKRPEGEKKPRSLKYGNKQSGGDRRIRERITGERGFGRDRRFGGRKPFRDRRNEARN